MQTVKSFIFIIVLFNSVNVLSDTCKTQNGPITHSTFVPAKTATLGTCICNSGYSRSGFSGDKKTQNEFDVGAKCTENNNWVVPLVIGSGILVATATVAGATRYGYNRYKAYKAKLNAKTHASDRINAEDSGEPWEGWEGTEGEYLQSDNIYSRSLRGAYRLENLTDPVANPLLTEQQAALDNSPSFKWSIADSAADTAPRIRYDPTTKSNIMVDSDGRALSKWNADAKNWSPVRGAERWRYSERLGYRVIAKTNDNFLNPNTGEFQADKWESSWRGQSLNDYLNDFKITPELQGSGSPLKGLSAATRKLDSHFDLQYKVSSGETGDTGLTMKYNPATKTNILVDKQNRLAKTWNRVDKRWEPTEGAERWRYSDTFQHKIIAKNNTDFLNPRTGEFETIPTDNEWSGEFMEESYEEAVSSEVFTGVGNPLNVTDKMKFDGIFDGGVKVDGLYDKDLEVQRIRTLRYRSFNTSHEVNLSRNLTDNKSILVDRNKRLLAKWNRVTKDWDPVDGASRWRYSKTLKYRVIANNNSNMYNPTSKQYQEIPSDNPPWEGSWVEYTTHPGIKGYRLKGVGDPLKNLTDPQEGAELSLQRQNTSAYNFAQNKNIRIKYDPASGENIVVDNDSRVLARWDAGDSANEWKAVDGAERWEFHPKFKYDVIATDSTEGIANNYLNPHTGKFVNTSKESWEEDSMESSDVFGANAAPTARGRVISIVHKNKAYFEDEIYEDNVDLEADFVDFRSPTPLSPAVQTEGKSSDFHLFREGEPDFDSDSDSDSGSDFDVDQMTCV